MLTPRAEDVLKLVYRLSQEDAAVSNASLIARSHIPGGAMTGLLRRLGDEGLLEYTPYHGARLTDAGRVAAARLLRRHRLLELFLTTWLGYSWDQVHEEAERLEHVASEELVERIARVLGDPRSDPHGAPIPDPSGAFQKVRLPNLSEVAPGRTVILRQVTEEDAELLQYLGCLALHPGCALQILDRIPFDRAVRVRVGSREEVLAAEVCGVLRVEPVETH